MDLIHPGAAYLNFLTSSPIVLISSVGAPFMKGLFAVNAMIFVRQSYVIPVIIGKNRFIPVTVGCISIRFSNQVFFISFFRHLCRHPLICIEIFYHRNIIIRWFNFTIIRTYPLYFRLFSFMIRSQTHYKYSSK